MKFTLNPRVILFYTLTALILAGCGGEPEMSQDDIQYLSHVDQSRFFQRQGELKASTMEARSAIELKPDNIEPYFIILDNLLKAGDAVTAERQLNQVLELFEPTQIPAEMKNRATLIRAEANYLQGRFEQALEALETFADSDRPSDTKAAILEGRIHLAANQFSEATSAFQRARETDPTEVDAYIGLSKTAFAMGDETRMREWLDNAEEVDSESGELWLWKAQLADHNKEWQKAEDAYIKALEEIGQYDVMTQRKYATISSLIRVLRAQGKQSEAFVYEEILAKSAPGTIKSNLLAAQDALESGNLDNAARYLEEVLNQAPNHEQTALMLGLVRFRQGRVDEAEALLAPIAQSGNSETASKLLAATRLQMRDPQGAQEILSTLEDKDSDPETLAMVAIAALSSGEFDAGEKVMEQALDANPKNHDLRLRYAAYLIQRGATDRAIEQAAYVRDHAEVKDQAWNLIIQAHLQSGNTKAAVAVADEWISKAPESTAALLARGTLARQADEPDKARTYYERALTLAPKSAEVLIALGNLDVAQEKPEAARRQFTEAVQIAPDNRAALQGVVSVLSRAETNKLMRDILQAKPDATGPRLILLESALRDEQTQETDELTASLLEREAEGQPAPAAPFVAGIYNSVAAFLQREGNQEQAAQVLARARVLFPENEDIALRAAQQAFDAADTDGARKILQEIKQYHPDSARPYVLEAAYFENQGEHRQAAELYQLALEKEPGAELSNRYARSLQNAGKPEEALAFIDKATTTFPDSHPLLLTRAMLNQTLGNVEQAKTDYERLISEARDNIIVLNNLAWLYHQDGNPEAVNLARRAYELEPDNAAVLDTYGWILLQQGNVAESVPLLEKAHQLQPDSEEIALHLAEAYRAIGKNANAQKVLEKFGGQG